MHSTQPEQPPVKLTTVSQHSATQYNLQLEFINELTQIITRNIQFQDSLWFLQKLEEACKYQWLLTTSQIKELIGVYPKCKKGEKAYRRGSFAFFKEGKIGNQTSWKIKKIVDD